MSRPRTTVLIPTLNEEASIGKTLDQIPRTEDMEIAIIDGLSVDRTREIARGKGARVIEESRRGYGRAYKTGFREAGGEVIVTLDGDTTYPADLIPDLVGMLDSEGLDFISCERITRADPGAFSVTHAFGNWLLKFLTNLLFRTRLVDSQTGMWVFRREVLKKVRLTSDGMPLSEEFKVEVFTNPSIKAREVAVPYHVREGEKKLATFKDGWRNISFLFRKRFSPSRLGAAEEF